MSKPMIPKGGEYTLPMSIKAFSDIGRDKDLTVIEEAIIEAFSEEDKGVWTSMIIESASRTPKSVVIMDKNNIIHNAVKVECQKLAEYGYISLSLYLEFFGHMMLKNLGTKICHIFIGAYVFNGELTGINAIVTPLN